MKVPLGFTGALVLRFGLTLLFSCLVRGGDNFGVVNIASLLNTGYKDDWDVFALYQDPKGELFLRSWNKSGWKDPKPCRVTIPPKKGTRLAVNYIYTGSKEDDGDNGNSSDTRTTVFSLLYLDEDNKLTLSTARLLYETMTVEGWETVPLDILAYSGFALSDDDNIYYVDYDSQKVMEVRNATDTERPPPRDLGVKAASESTLAITRPVGTTDLYLFYIDEDYSLSYIKNDGKDWSKGKTAVEDFASDPTMGFAAVAWSDPEEVRVFYIDEDWLPSEWIFKNSTWTHSPEGLPDRQGNAPGQPVAAASFRERSIEYFYASERTIIDLVKKPGMRWIVGGLGAFDISSPPGPPLSKSDKIALGTALGVGIPSVILALLGLLMIRRRSHRTSPERKDALGAYASADGTSSE